MSGRAGVYSKVMTPKSLHQERIAAGSLLLPEALASLRTELANVGIN